MIDWLKHIQKDYPDFWKQYLLKMDKKPQRFVVLRPDQTGTNPESDVIISLSAVGIDANNHLCIGDTFEVTLLQYKFTHDEGLSHDLVIQTPFEKRTEDQGIQAFIDYIGNSMLVGYHINATLELINKALERMKLGRLRNEAIDLEIVHQKLTQQRDKSFTMKQLLDAYSIKLAHDSFISDEVYALALMFLKVRKKIGIL
jgi:DNA polymerase-3 subunit epsilon